VPGYRTDCSRMHFGAAVDLGSDSTVQKAGFEGENRVRPRCDSLAAPFR
jgi:hypothetical protein